MAFYMIIMESQKQQLTKQIVNAQSIVIFSLKYLLTKQISRVWSLGIFVYSCSLMLGVSVTSAHRIERFETVFIHLHDWHLISMLKLLSFNAS